MIIKRPQSRADMINIWQYIADHSPSRADAFLDMLYRKFELLEQKPLSGRLRDELESDLRSFPYGNYLIFYRPVKNGIEITRILHGARDLTAIFHAEQDDKS